MAGVYMKQGRTDLPTLFLRNLRSPPQFKLAPSRCSPGRSPRYLKFRTNNTPGGVRAHARDSDTPHADHNIIRLIAINIATLTGRTKLEFQLHLHSAFFASMDAYRSTEDEAKPQHPFNRCITSPGGPTRNRCITVSPGTGPSAPRMIGDTW